MAERPIWRGHLRLALVSCPVALYTAKRETNNLHFHFINPDTGHRVRMTTHDAETGEELQRGHLSRGYEFKKDHYLVLNDEDFESARIESSSTLSIDKFVDASSIDPIYYESSYFLVPDGDSATDVYVVLRDAIAQAGRVALSRVVISRRERAVAIMPMGRGMVVHTLNEEKDIADPAHLFETVPDARPDADMVKLATQLIDRQTGRYDPADMEDRYEARLRAVIDAKLRGQGIEPDAPDEPEETNVIDLMAALKRSLGQAVDKPARAKPALAKSGSAKSGSAKSGPAKSGLAKSGPAKSGSAKSAAAKTPAKTASKPPAKPARKRA